MSLAPVTHVTKSSAGLDLSNESVLHGVVEVDNMLRSDGDAIARGRVEVPSLQYLQDLLLNAVPHSLQHFGFYDIALRIDRNLHDYVPLHSRRQIAA